MHPIAGYSSGLLAPGQRAPCRGRQRTAFASSMSLAVLCLSVAFCVDPVGAMTPSDRPSALHIDICGDIVEGTWTAGGYYHVTCDATLPLDTALTIEPGVEVQFAAEVSLTVAGTLSAIGAPDQPITFTSDQESPASGDWAGLHFVAGASESQISWCLVEYATTGVRVYAGPGETVGPAFSDCTVRYNSMHGIQIEGEALECYVGLAEPTITRCMIEFNGGYGIYGHGYGNESALCGEFAPGSVGGVVTGSAIRQNQATGICLDAEWEEAALGEVWIAVEANAISGNGGHGLYLVDDDLIHLDDYDLVHPRIENNLIYANAGAGLWSDAKHVETDLLIVNNTIAGNAGDGLAFNHSAAQAHLVNNIVVHNAGYGLVCAGVPIIQAANNDLWANVAGDYVGCLIGPTDISADPLFADHAGRNFHLTFGSPCVDAGTSEGAPLTDIEGIERPKGEGVDIGAHELWCRRVYLPVVLRE